MKLPGGWQLYFHGMQWEPRDAWVGVFWRHTIDGGGERSYRFYVCLVPFLPVVFDICKMVNPAEWAVFPDGKAHDRPGRRC